MHLYNFIYYKSLFNFNDYDYLVRYNNYYISGLNSSKCQETEITTISKEPIAFSPIKYDKITLPKFNYPILDDDDDNIKDNIKSGFKKLKDDIKDDDEYKQPNLLDRLFNFF